jgi:hypothetical protein
MLNLRAIPVYTAVISHLFFAGIEITVITEVVRKGARTGGNG